MTTQEFLNALIIYKSLCQLKHVHSNISAGICFCMIMMAVVNRFLHAGLQPVLLLGGDYMIPVCQSEISPRLVGTDPTLRLHVEIKFRHGKAGQFFTWHLFRFACKFFEFFFVSMSVNEIENP